MVAYFENEQMLDNALNEAKTASELYDILLALEIRMAPHHWIDKAYNAYKNKI